MADTVDFRVTETLAVGHDPLNTIIYVARKTLTKSALKFDGQSWRPVRFIGLDKAVLIRDLIELGAPSDVRNHRDIREMLSDLRRWRAERDRAVSTSEAAQEGDPEATAPSPTCAPTFSGENDKCHRDRITRLAERCSGGKEGHSGAGFAV